MRFHTVSTEKKEAKHTTQKIMWNETALDVWLPSSPLANHFMKWNEKRIEKKILFLSFAMTKAYDENLSLNKFFSGGIRKEIE